jgi:YHS domain-containing protein
MMAHAEFLDLEGLEEDTMVKDPVCGMYIEEEEAEGESQFEGQTYYFCSAECKEEFDAEPDRYIEQPV